ncbi:hypothetical protein LTS10_011140 [Elasticomyces elasticus]|nr:hypothetical protein LTS10_011140 [Elasticomyces elasticus]
MARAWNFPINTSIADWSATTPNITRSTRTTPAVAATNHSRLAYDRCYDTTDFTHFTVNPTNADPVNPVNGTDGTASPTTPVNANPTNGTGAAVPLNKGHGLSTTELGLVIAIPVCVFLFIVLCIMFKGRLKDFVSRVRGRDEPSIGLDTRDEAPMMANAGPPHSRTPPHELVPMANVTGHQIHGHPDGSTTMANVTELQNRAHLGESTAVADVTTQQNQTPLDNSIATTVNLANPQSWRDFRFAILCALALEMDMVRALFEVDLTKMYGKAEGDRNHYAFGILGGKPVVLARLRDMGKLNAAEVASGLRLSFSNIKIGFVVGVAGGAPHTSGENGKENSIFLGDVVVSTAVVQTDFGRQRPDRFWRKTKVESTLGRTGPWVASFLGLLDTSIETEQLAQRTLAYRNGLLSTKRIERPTSGSDRLFAFDYRHKHPATANCEECNSCVGLFDSVCDVADRAKCADLGCGDHEVIRRRTDVSKTSANGVQTEETRPLGIHFGRFASADAVMRSGVHRERLMAEEGVIGFEMEAAGTWDQFDTVTVKSVCDYADSHKNKDWQASAAATAASCTKAILEKWVQAGRADGRAPM